ncbi:MAG: protein kinase, partial [Chloroflexota bacterium]
AISPGLHPRTENHLAASPWFRLVGLDQLSTAVQDQNSPYLDFSNDELRALAAEALHLTRLDPPGDGEPAQEKTTSLPAGFGEPPLPPQIGRYRPLALVGRGGMGMVYRAYDPHLNREVVLKLIFLPDPAKGYEFQERFRREVQAAGQLNHPNIVTIYDVNLDHRPPFVVMELLTGGTLQDRLRSGPVPWPEALLLLRPLAEALAYAHRVGVIHRDVKPANVLFGGDGNVLKLVDFGLARWQSSEQITQSGLVVGTPAYMSPEQARGEPVDARTDIFALGVMLYEAMVGHNPLLKETLTSTLLEAISDHELDLSSLRERAPEPVIKLVGRAVARDRGLRYPTCEALLADLDRGLPDLTTIAMFPPGPRRSDVAAGPDIRQAGEIDLSAEVISVLRTMFKNFSRVAVETEFDRGFSGSHVLQVRLVETGDRPQLPAVVKIAPISLIHREMQAYRLWVENRLPNIARLDLDHTFMADGPLGGLSYALVGGGTFEVQSLFDYCQTADIDDVCWVLENRLFEILGQNWWLDNRLDRTFQMQADYDTLLPFNLLLKGAAATGPAPPHVIGPESDPAKISVQAGQPVQLQRFIITKIDPDRGHVTLNLPPVSVERPLRSYQVRLIDAPDISIYQVGHMLDLIQAEVVATRRDLLVRRVRQVLGDGLDLAVEQLNLSTGRATSPALNAPNPL